MNRYGVARTAMAVVLAGWLLPAPAMAVDIPSAGGVINISAVVPTNLTFTATIFELVPSGTGTAIGPQVTAMNFGNLASNGTFDPDGIGPLPPQPRALNSTKAFQVFFAINSQGRAYQIKQTATTLRSGVNTIPDGAFIVTPLSGVGGNPATPLPAGITVGTRGTAVFTNKVLFSSTGPTSTLATTYGITDDATLGATQFIPLTQPAGTYTTTVTFTATVT